MVRADVATGGCRTFCGSSALLLYLSRRKREAVNAAVTSATSRFPTAPPCAMPGVDRSTHFLAEVRTGYKFRNRNRPVPDAQNRNRNRNRKVIKFCDYAFIPLISGRSLKDGHRGLLGHLASDDELRPLNNANTIHHWINANALKEV